MSHSDTRDGVGTPRPQVNAIINSMYTVNKLLGPKAWQQPDVRQVIVTTMCELRGVNLGGRGTRIWSGGTPMYNVPQILTFSLYFSLT